MKKRRNKQQSDSVVEIFSENMRNLMEGKEMTFADLDELTGIPSSSLNYYANGKVMIPLPAAKAIASAFGLTVDIMLTEKMSVLKKDA